MHGYIYTILYIYIFMVYMWASAMRVLLIEYWAQMAAAGAQAKSLKLPPVKGTTSIAMAMAMANGKRQEYLPPGGATNSVWAKDS